jgi:hypothetical protein
MEKKPSDRTPEAILNDLDKYEKVANKNLDILPVRLRPTHEIAAREAREKMVALKTEYRQRLLSNSLGLFTTGGTPAAAQKFAEVSASEGLLVVDCNELYMKLAEKIEPAVGSKRHFTVDHLMLLHQEMQRVRSDAGYNRAIDLPTLAAVHTVPNTAALATYIRTLVVKAGAGVVNALYVSNRMVGDARQKRFKGKTFAVVVVNSTDEDRKLLTGTFSRTDTVSLEGVAPEAIDGDFAVAAFKAAKKRTAQ